MKDAKPSRLIRALKAEGFVENGGTKHRKMIKVENGQTLALSISVHKVVKSKTVERIRKQAGISKEKFYSYSF